MCVCGVGYGMVCGGICMEGMSCVSLWDVCSYVVCVCGVYVSSVWFVRGVCVCAVCGVCVMCVGYVVCACVWCVVSVVCVVFEAVCVSVVCVVCDVCGVCVWCVPETYCLIEPAFFCSVSNSTQ